MFDCVAQRIKLQRLDRFIAVNKTDSVLWCPCDFVQVVRSSVVKLLLQRCPSEIALVVHVSDSINVINCELRMPILQQRVIEEDVDKSMRQKRLAFKTHRGVSSVTFARIQAATILELYTTMV